MPEGAKKEAKRWELEPARLEDLKKAEKGSRHRSKIGGFNHGSILRKGPH